MAQQLLLNEYKKIKEIGQGSFAKVYQVRHIDLNYIRAIRILNASVSDENDSSYQTFLKECKALLQLGNGGHPNIVRIYQPRFLQNHALVEMDYIDGCDLDDYIKSQDHFVPIDEVMRFAHDICGALAYCHVDNYEFSYDVNKKYEYKLESKFKGKIFTIEPDPNDGNKDFITDLQRQELIREYGITHNDLHSRNIMRKRYDGSYILLDFGLAIQDGKAVKSSSRRDGAVEYKAPEKGEKDAEILPSSDIYGFGVLLYEMLAGRVPFPYDREKYSREEETLFRLAEQHVKDAPPAIEPLRRAAFETANPGQVYEKDYPDWLETIIMKCLAKEPKDRYANAKELSVEFKTRMANIDSVNHNIVNELKAINETLNNELGTLSYQKTELNDQIISLKTQLASSKSNSNDAEVMKLKGKIATLRNGRPKSIWRMLAGIFALLMVAGTVGGFYVGIDSTPPVKVVPDSSLEQALESLNRKLDEAETQITRLTNENQTLRSNPGSSSTALADKQREINRLESEIVTLKANLQKANSNSAASTANQQEITKLQQEINTLKTSVQQKDRTIATQQQQLQTAQSTIEKLANQ